MMTFDQAYHAGWDAAYLGVALDSNPYIDELNNVVHPNNPNTLSQRQLRHLKNIAYFWNFGHRSATEVKSEHNEVTRS